MAHMELPREAIPNPRAYHRERAIFHNCCIADMGSHQNLLLTRAKRATPQIYDVQNIVT